MRTTLRANACRARALVSPWAKLHAVAAAAELAICRLACCELAAIAAISHVLSLCERLAHVTLGAKPQGRIDAVAVNGLLIEKEENLVGVLAHCGADVRKPAV